MADVRVTQVVLEALADGDPTARITQLALEAMVTEPPQVRMTQAVLETLVTEPPLTYVSQLVLEVMADDITVEEILQTVITATTVSIDRGAHNLHEPLVTTITATTTAGDVMAAVEPDLQTSIVYGDLQTDRFNLTTGSSGFGKGEISTYTDTEPGDDPVSSTLGP